METIWNTVVEFFKSSGIAGFFEASSHDIVEIDRCINAEEAINFLSMILKEAPDREVDAFGRGIVEHRLLQFINLATLIILSSIHYHSFLSQKLNMLFDSPEMYIQFMERCEKSAH